MFFHKNDEGEKKETEGKRGKVVPLLPLRDIIVFPHMVVPLFVGREKSINALEEAMSHEKEILLAAQKKAKTNDPTPDDIFQMGTVGTIIQLLRLPDGTVKVLVEGKRRARIQRFIPNEEFFLCEVENVAEESEAGVEVEALMRSVQSTFETYVKLNKRIPPEMLMTVQTIDDPSRLADTIVVHLTSIKLNDRQEILETTDPGKRLERLFELMNNEIEILQVEKKIRSRVKKQMEKSQKEYYLNEQMQAIQKELGERDEFKSEIQEIEEKLKTKKLSKEALTKVKKELKKLKMMQPMSAEATVVRNYIDWVLALPWYDKSDENYDIDKAEEILDEDHYGLKKPKERILEYLAVQALVKKLKGPVLCLVGPPGVGKTSLARSIARATGREFVRLSLGGVRDEAEIRGHRRTYIGALPGRLIQSLRKVGTNNPVFLLDEIDKMSSDFRGDPASALLEVLDPEQNTAFLDHYLDLRVDLSQVLFICTANQLDTIPGPLLDRMEVLRLAGYVAEEKLAIAKHHLWPKQLERHGLPPEQLKINDAALKYVIESYCREAGVRNLEKQLARIMRKSIRKLMDDDRSAKLRVGKKDIEELLGKPLYTQERPQRGVGVATGLAWTAMGGATLAIESSQVHTLNRGFKLTGKLGDVMKESAEIAYSYVVAHLKDYGCDRDFFDMAMVHLHVPEGATPKDGPSAGITMATALVSLARRERIRRPLAMTGELTLTGQVLAVGGIREKIIAARRSRIFEVILPQANKRDYEELPDYLRDGMTAHFARSFREVFEYVFSGHRRDGALH